MKVKVSKVLVNYLNTMAKNDALKIDRAEYVEFSPEQYRWSVSYDVWGNECDYSAATGKFKAIRITYPYDYYSVPRYITTNELLKEFLRLPSKDENSFRRMLKDVIEI